MTKQILNGWTNGLKTKFAHPEASSVFSEGPSDEGMNIVTKVEKEREMVKNYDVWLLSF